MKATSMKAFLIGLTLVLGSWGCATESTTVRTMSQPPAQEDQTPVASYPVPKTDPKGTAYVMSLGRESLASPAGAQALYLHLRLAVENKSDTTGWTLDAHDQVVNLGGGPAEPTYARSSTGGSVVTVAPGQQDYLDLFYALAPGSNPPQAVLTWQVRRGTESVTDSTPFALQSAQTPEYAYYQPVGVTVQYWPASWWGVGFYGPWWWGPGWGPYPYGGWYAGYRGGFGPYYRGGYGPYHYGAFGRGGFGPGMHGGPHLTPPPPRGGGWRGPPPPSGGRGFGGMGRMRFPGFPR
jgi:hypothetical protein